MKTKITSKNKNIINIKINTDKRAKKSKSRRRPKHTGSPKGRSNYNSGYSLMPPIIINPAPAPAFPNYTQQQPQINYASREHTPIRQESTVIHHETPVHHQPVHHEPPQATINPQETINPVNVSPEPIGKLLHTRARQYTPYDSLDEFINPPSTVKTPFTADLGYISDTDDDDDLDGYINVEPRKKPATPTLDAIFKMRKETDENLNPISSLKGSKIYPDENHDDVYNVENPSSFTTKARERHREHLAINNAAHHSVVDNFDNKEADKNKYANMLAEYKDYRKNNNLGEDPDFIGKGEKPSKQRYRSLQSRLRKAHKNLDSPIVASAKMKPTSNSKQIFPSI